MTSSLTRHLLIALALLAGPSSALGFVDDFNRADSTTIGNGWQHVSGNVGGNLELKDGKVTSTATNGRAGIYRPVTFSAPVSITATLTELSGFGGVARRYQSSFALRSNGVLGDGYRLAVQRGDENFSDSRVTIVDNGSTVATLDSTFQYGPTITIAATFNPDGSISGSVSDTTNTFVFSFGARVIQSSGSNFSYETSLSNPNSSTFIYPTFDDFILTDNACGDGAVDAEEECDDGNVISGDCCSSTCQFETPGTACGQSSSTVCDQPDTCNGSGACQSNNEPNTTVCRADAGQCDVAETCDGFGACPDDAFEPAGTSCGSSNATACDNPDTCDAIGVCQANHAASTTVCRPGVDPCDVLERCDGAGLCPANLFAPAGTSCGSPSDTVCDNPDTCDGTGTCEDNREAASIVCRAAVSDCDIPENCTGDASDCPSDTYVEAGTACATDGNICTDDECDGIGECAHTANSSPCSDGLFCNGADQCEGGSCSGHAGNPCAGPDGDMDCSESCSESTDSCTTSDPDFTACDDGDNCTAAETCLSGQCTGSNEASCGLDDGCCPAGCSIETDDDCEVCYKRSIVLSQCDIRVKRRSSPTGTDSLTAKCAVDACDATFGISPSTEGIRFTLADVSGIAFDDALDPSECRQKASGYQCKPASTDDVGVRVLKLRALTACTYSLKLKVTRADLTALDASQFPWVSSLIIGPAQPVGAQRDCGDVGCPVVEVDRVTCPGSCGDDDASDAGEQCDGLDDAACPGRCDSTCTCR